MAAWIGIVLLVALSLLGLNSHIGQLSDAATTGQWICTWTQLGYALGGLVAAGGLLMGKSWYRPALWIWAGCITVTAGLAPVVWGGSGLMEGLAAGAATAVIAGVVILLATWRLRGRGGGLRTEHE